MTIKEQIEFLRAHSSQTPSKWKEKAEWRRNNTEFLKKFLDILPRLKTVGFLGI